MSLMRIKRSFTDFIQKRKKTKNTKAYKSMDDITSFTLTAPEDLGDKTLTSPNADEKTFVNDIFQAYHEPSVLDVRRAVKYGLNDAPGSLLKVAFPHASMVREITLEVLNETETKDLSLIPRTPLLPSTPVFEDSLALSSDSFTSPYTPSLICSTPDLSVVPFNGPRVAKIDDFQLLQFLSKGAWGQVHLAKDMVSNRRVAIKVMKRTEKMFTIPIVRKMLIQEKNIMASLQGCEWFVQLQASWCDSNNLYLAMTYYPTDLDSEIIRCERLPATRARFYMAEIIIALEELHKRGIVHRDVKAANVLIRTDGHVVLADFGYSKDFGRKPTIAERSYQPYWPFRTDDDVCKAPRRSPTELTFVADEMLGSELEMAPEIVLQDYYSFGVDFWAASATLYLMVTGRYAWSEEKEKSIQLQILEDEVEFEAEDEVSEECQDFIRQMLKKEPEDRLRIGLDMTSHPYFAGLDWEAMRNREIPSPWVPDFVSGHYFYDDWDSLEMFEPGVILEKDEEDLHEFIFISPEMEQCVETPLEAFFRWGTEDEVEDDDDDELWSSSLEDGNASCEVDQPYSHVKTYSPVMSKSDTLASISPSFHSMSSLFGFEESRCNPDESAIPKVLDGPLTQATTCLVIETEPEIETQYSKSKEQAIQFPGCIVTERDALAAILPSGLRVGHEETMLTSLRSTHGSQGERIESINTKVNRRGRLAELIEKVGSWLNKFVSRSTRTMPMMEANTASVDLSICGKIKGIFKKIFGLKPKCTTKILLIC